MMQNLLFNPIPDLDTLPSPNEQNKTALITANIDAQRNRFRARVIASAKADIAAHYANPHDINEASVIPAPAVSPPANSDLSRMLASLNSTTRLPALHPPAQTTPSAGTATVPQARTPYEVHVAQGAMKQLEQYDAVWKSQRDALNPAPAGGVETANGGAALGVNVVDRGRDPRLQATGRAENGGAAEAVRMNGGGDIDRGRDPRRR